MAYIVQEHQKFIDFDAAPAPASTAHCAQCYDIYSGRMRKNRGAESADNT
jgi:hypothetical protein